MPLEQIEPDSSSATQRFTLKSFAQVGLPLGTAVGRGVGPAVVLTTGAGVGLGVGRADGAGVGIGVGRAVGDGDGEVVGRGVGAGVGLDVGVALGCGVGIRLGSAVGAGSGSALGAALGGAVGVAVGCADGAAVGWRDVSVSSVGTTPSPQSTRQYPDGGSAAALKGSSAMKAHAPSPSRSFAAVVEGSVVLAMIHRALDVALLQSAS